ncbi:MAG TPA: hypothetical protein PLA50_02270 [Bacteroidia bacterium]|nr:hypothetical protein [Bacteroidia bacterium]
MNERNDRFEQRLPIARGEQAQGIIPSTWRDVKKAGRQTVEAVVVISLA